ncbi:MAG: glutamine-hydrolyzing GMP synthase, partial [Candidatus Sericytochromatia bacterium]|nr:glutamine-hydrolyzing GMP synthase [Candidatus Tanganyikabacteria bacterium]
MPQLDSPARKVGGSLGTALDAIAILDYGSQYTQLIARRVRELGVFSRIYPPGVAAADLADPAIRGIILSGGPGSVHEQDALTLAAGILELGKPILGICYGMQLLNHLQRGLVVPGTRREYGRAAIRVEAYSPLFGGMADLQEVWMSHGDRNERLAEEFVAVARTESGVVAAMESRQRPIFGLQFHPEVTHTPQGIEILRNFLRGVCDCDASWSLDGHLDSVLTEIRETVGDRRVAVLVSGGVDSTVTAALLARALPPGQVVAIHV